MGSGAFCMIWSYPKALASDVRLAPHDVSYHTKSNPWLTYVWICIPTYPKVNHGPPKWGILTHEKLVWINNGHLAIFFFFAKCPTQYISQSHKCQWPRGQSRSIYWPPHPLINQSINWLKYFSKVEMGVYIYIYIKEKSVTNTQRSVSQYIYNPSPQIR